VSTSTNFVRETQDHDGYLERECLYCGGADIARSSGRRPLQLTRYARDNAALLENSMRQLYEDLGSTDKVFIDLACSSHNAMWERNHLLLFQASLEWLSDGNVNGTGHGMLELGYQQFVEVLRSR
jgi:hypothetical protein